MAAPPMIPGGIRERAYKAALRGGPRDDRQAADAASRAYWRQYRIERGLPEAKRPVAPKVSAP